MALLGPSPKTVIATPPSPVSLWKHLGAAAIGSRSSEQGVEISLAPQSLATPPLLPLTKSPAERTDVSIQPHCAHQDASATGLQACVPPQGTQDSGGGGGWSAEPPSPLSQFIGMFQSASRREVSKHILRVWKKRTVAARRLSAASLTASSGSRLSLSSSSALESPTGIADQDDLGASGTLFNIQFSTRQQGDAPTRSGPSQEQQQQQHKLLADTLGQVFWWVRTLLLRVAFRQWSTTARARALGRLALQRFRSRRLRRLLYSSFLQWGFACHLK
jgi:hypothetical protein